MSDAFTSDTYNALCKEAETYLSRGLTEQARELLLKAVSLIGTRSRARSLLADSCMSLGLWAEAREQLEQLTTLEIGSIQHHYRLGQVLEEMGEVEVARDNYLVVLDIDRDHRGAAAAMARLAGKTPPQTAPEPRKAPAKPATDFQIFPDDANATDEFASGDEVESLLKDIGVSPDGGADTGVTELLSKVGISLENPAAKEPEREPTDISRLLGEDAVKKDRSMSLEDIFGTGPAVPEEQEEEPEETAAQAPAAAGDLQVEPGGFDLASVFGGPGKVDSTPVEGLETAAAAGPAEPSPAAPPVQGLETFFEDRPSGPAAEPPASLERLFEGGEMAVDIPVSNEPPSMEALFSDSPAAGAPAAAVPAPEPVAEPVPPVMTEPAPEIVPVAVPEAPQPVAEPPALESIFAEAAPMEAAPAPEPVAEPVPPVMTEPAPEIVPEAVPEAPQPVAEPPALESIFAEAAPMEAAPMEAATAPEPVAEPVPTVVMEPAPEMVPEAVPEAPQPVAEPPVLESIFAEAAPVEAAPVEAVTAPEPAAEPVPPVAVEPEPEMAPEPAPETPEPAVEPPAAPPVGEVEVRGAPGIEIVFGAAAPDSQPAMQTVLEGAAGFSIDLQGSGAPVTVRLEQGELDVRTAFLLAMDAGLEMHADGQRRFVTGRGALIFGQASRTPVVLELSRGDLVRVDKLAVFDRALSLTDAGLPDLPSMHRVDGAAGLALAFTGGPTALVDTAGGALARATSIVRLEAGVTVSRAAGPEGFVRLDGEGTAVVAP